MTRAFRPVTIVVPTLPVAQFLLGRLTGRDELVMEPGRRGGPSLLLAELVRSVDGGAVDLGALPATLHDRLLADIFVTELGDAAACRASCSACAEPFEFGLSVRELIAAQDAEAAGIGLPGADGCWAVAAVRVRVPTLADAALGRPMLQQVCTPAPEDEAAVAAFLERALPLLTVDLDVTCPHCGSGQSLTFDLPRFLQRSIASERPFLIRETHLIAARYGWSHAEIMALPRGDRRAYASLIESERSAALRSRAVG